MGVSASQRRRLFDLARTPIRRTGTDVAFVLAAGETHSVCELAEHAFAAVEIPIE
jgi:GDP-D-mannose dehydratase